MDSIGALIGVCVAIIVLLVIVALVLLPRGRGRSSRPEAPRFDVRPSIPTPASTPVPTPEITAAQAQETIAQLLQQGKKIEAIKVFREQTGVGLKAAKEAVERGTFATSPVTPPVSNPDPGALSAEVSTEIDRLLASGSPIEAIKLLRAHTALGLKEAKDAIDRWVPGSFS